MPTGHPRSPLRGRISRFRTTLDELARLCDIPDQTRARFRAETLIAELRELAHDHSQLTLKELLVTDIEFVDNGVRGL